MVQYTPAAEEQEEEEDEQVLAAPSIRGGEDKLESTLAQLQTLEAAMNH